MAKKQKGLVATCMTAAESLHTFLNTLQLNMKLLARDITTAMNQNKLERNDDYKLPWYVFDVEFGDGTNYCSGQVKSTMKSNVT